MAKSTSFKFDGGAADWLGTAIAAALITFFTLGIGYPFAICVIQSWKTKHTLIDGRRLSFSGTGFSLIGVWIKWWFFLVITLGIYSFWIVPNLQRWITENTHFEDEHIQYATNPAPVAASSIPKPNMSERSCSGCGETNGADHAFCVNCGAALV